MEFKDVPKQELDSGNFSENTIDRLMSIKKKEYRAYLKTSSAKNIPMILGTYLATCSALAGYALSQDESALAFTKIYLALFYIWLPFCVMLPLRWYNRRPKVKDLVEELGWYKELLNTREATFKV